MKLERAAYQALLQRVLQRDSWRCQHCGRRTNLEVHHLIRRSRLGDDSEENLIVLCNICHRVAHQQHRPDM